MHSLAASPVKNVGEAKSCNFPTDICKFLTEEIMGVENFNFARKFFQMWASGPNSVFLKENFWTRNVFRQG